MALEKKIKKAAYSASFDLAGRNDYLHVSEPGEIPGFSISIPYFRDKKAGRVEGVRATIAFQAGKLYSVDEILTKVRLAKNSLQFKLIEIAEKFSGQGMNANG